MGPNFKTVARALETKLSPRWWCWSEDCWEPDGTKEDCGLIFYFCPGGKCQPLKACRGLTAEGKGSWACWKLPTPWARGSVSNCMRACVQLTEET